MKQKSEYASSQMKIKGSVRKKLEQYKLDNNLYSYSDAILLLLEKQK